MRQSPTITTLIISAACISIGVGISSALLLNVFLPDGFFGSCFEGSCGYAALLFAVACALVVGGLVLTILLRKAFRAAGESDQTVPKPTAPRFFFWVFIAMAIYMADYFLGIIGNLLVFAVLLPAFVMMSAQFFCRLGKSPLLSLLAVVPTVGPAIVMFMLAKPVWSSIRGTSSGT